MPRLPRLLPAIALLIAGTASSPLYADRAADKVAAMRDDALKDEVAYEITEGLTTEIGQRLAGTESEARAREWAVRRLKDLGFANVHIEPFDMPVWVRGAEAAEIVSPYPQKLVLAALGNSGATPDSGITAEVVGFATLDDLKAAPPEAVTGKIVFVSHEMKAAQDGSGYGYFGAVRRSGPSIASAKGAAAILIKSIGTDHHRVPHTGVQAWADGVRPIPAAALTVPDAEQLARILARGKPVTLHLTLTPRDTGVHGSGNVVADVPGRDPKAGLILIGGHLDSWDLGTGAIDDGAGVAITAAAARRFLAPGARPMRGIRLVWFGAEEEGGFGGIAYAKAHAGEKHDLVAESDFGADSVWRMQAKLAPTAKPVSDRLMAALAPLGIAPGRGEAHGGTDVEPTATSMGTAVVDLGQDGTRYFDLHHTPDDTFDKIDKAQMQQNVAAWTAMLGVVANADETLAPGKPAAAK